MGDLVSIVLPVYNGERYLKESIDSVLNQTYENWELIIVDDGSTDSTSKIAREYIENDTRIHYVLNEQNMKLPRSLNRGFSISKGDFLTWTSDDNRYMPDAIDRMHNALKTNNADFVFTSCQVINEAGEGIEYMMTDKSRLCELIGHNVVGACFMYTRRAYNEIGEYDPEYALVEDFDYWQRIYARFGAVVLDEILYEYRWHDNALTSTMSKYKFNSILEKMLLKNYHLFTEPSFESKYFYYQALFKCRKSMDDKQNPYIGKYSLYRTYYLFFIRIPRKIRRMIFRR